MCRFLPLALTIPRCRLRRSIPLDPFRAPRSSCPLRKALAPFFEYNLQTPLNARSRFKPLGTHRALLYQSVKISRPARARARARVASVPPSRNSDHSFCIYLSPPYEILTAGCLRARAAGTSFVILPRRLQGSSSNSSRNLLQKPRCNQTA